MSKNKLEPEIGNNQHEDKKILCATTFMENYRLFAENNPTEFQKVYQNLNMIKMIAKISGQLKEDPARMKWYSENLGTIYGFSHDDLLSSLTKVNEICTTTLAGQGVKNNDTSDEL